MVKTKKESRVSAEKVIVVGAGIAAVGVAAYLLLGPDGKKNRKKVKSWMMKMKAEVAEKLENMQEVTGPAYEKIIHEVADKYKKVKNIDAKDLQDEITYLKKEWKNVSKPKGAKKAVKKVLVKKKK